MEVGSFSWPLVAGLVLAWSSRPKPWVGASPVNEDRIVFAVAEGTRLRKTFLREVELTTQQGDSLLTLGSWRDRQRVVMLDTYGPLDSRVPETIVRSFERIETEHSHDWEIPLSWSTWNTLLCGSIERSGTGELVGSRVRFTRDRAESVASPGEHEASYAAMLVDDRDPADETAACLAGLRASTDSTGLLPWRETAVGDSWFVDVDAFHEICWPSGALGYVDSDGDRLITSLEERLGRNLDGTFRVELKAIETVAGVRYARMSLRGILESEATFPYSWSIGTPDLTLACEGPITLELYASLRGRLWWNLDAGHLDSIRIEGDVTIDQDFGGSRGEFQWGQWSGIFPDLIGPRVWTGTLVAEASFERV